MSIARYAISALLIFCDESARSDEWRYYAADASSSKYAPLSQISADNFNRLQEVWRYEPPDGALARNGDASNFNNKGTPLMADGVLYYASPLNILCALNPISGEELWTFDPLAWQKREEFLGILRGIAYWSSGGTKRIFFGTSTERLYSIDAETGEPDPQFGENGYVDLGKGLRRDIDRHRYGVSSPPIVCRDVVVVGSGIEDWHGRPPTEFSSPGAVRGFDARNGEQVWIFRTLPQPGEFGNETWENEAWKTYGQANVWSAMSADHELGYVYLPVSSATHNHYGGERPGANLFSNSLVCLEAATGRRIWHYQFIHHGLWNYDPPAAPVLADIEIDGRPIKAIAQVSKQAFCYVLNRVTGLPVWPIEEKQTPQSTIEGERSWPTQPLPERPAPYDLQGLQEDDLIDFTPELRNKALATIANYEHGPLFTPPSEQGTILVPGMLGGSDWTGAALAPEKNILYVPSRTHPFIVSLAKLSDEHGLSAHASFIKGHEYIDGLPLTKPPYGRVTAIDLETGEHLWTRAIGRGPILHEKLRDLDLPDLGWFQNNYAIVTHTMLLVSSQRPYWWGNLGQENFVERQPYLRAFDLDTGDILAEMPLAGDPGGNPISYMVGERQYLVFPINDDHGVPQLLALTLAQ